ncbi:hypothetical protein [Furfurilactobacillus entadae]|uniref:hypothetical protein n=1 Tax=Furfurilactobacillus entadae TaxID=2922307 RepID=UPI0035EF2B07
MTEIEFKEYLEANSNIKNMYCEQALTFQVKRNNARPAAKRWNEAKLDHAVERMYNPTVEQIYNQIQAAIQNKNATSKDWQHFLQNKNVFEDIEESMTEIQF